VIGKHVTGIDASSRAYNAEVSRLGGRASSGQPPPDLHTSPGIPPTLS